MAKAIRRKTERFALRTTEDQKRVIEQAAQLRQTTASEFMLQVVYQEALRVLEDASRLRLTQNAWEHFCAALDQPARVIPALKTFLEGPNIFESLDSVSVVWDDSGKDG